MLARPVNKKLKDFAIGSISTYLNNDEKIPTNSFSLKHNFQEAFRTLGLLSFRRIRELLAVKRT